MNKAMSVAGVVFRSQRLFLGYTFCDLLLLPFSDCRTYLLPFVAFGSALVWLISVRSVTVQPLFLSV